MITTILFDIDGVLLDSFETNYRFYLDIMKSAGYPGFDREKYLNMNHLTYIDTVKFLSGETDKEKLKTFWKLLEDTPYRELELSKMPPGEKETIEGLSKKYKVGIVTSRVKKGVDTYLQLSGLKNYFRTIVGFEDYKNPKPHPDPLFTALNKLGEKAENAIYIGDTSVDHKAAKAAGTKFICFTGVTGKEIEGEINVGSFGELEKTLGKLNYE